MPSKKSVLKSSWIIALLVFGGLVTKSQGLYSIPVDTVGIQAESVKIGSKSGGNFGIVSINNAGIQDSVISKIPELLGSTISNQAATLMVSPVTSYLLFNVLKNGENFSVAIEVIYTSFIFVFDTNLSKEVHICRTSTLCGTCNFVKEGNRLVGCGCGNSGGDEGCEHKQIGFRL